jgi:hypothetical protein
LNVSTGSGLPSLFAYKIGPLIFIVFRQYNLACDDLKKAMTLGFTQMYGDEV